MPTHDYECANRHRFEVFETSWRLMPEHPDCPRCGMEASRIYAGKWGGIHPSHSGMYGKFHPGFGVVVEDYAHKQRLLRETGQIEASDRTGGSRSYVPAEYSEAAESAEVQKMKQQATWAGTVPGDVQPNSDGS